MPLPVRPAPSQSAGYKRLSHVAYLVLFDETVIKAGKSRCVDHRLKGSILTTAKYDGRPRSYDSVLWCFGHGSSQGNNWRHQVSVIGFGLNLECASLLALFYRRLVGDTAIGICPISFTWPLLSLIDGVMGRVKRSDR